MFNTDKKKSRGFTLIEVLVTMVVVSMVLTLIYQAFSKTIESKDYVEAGNEMYHELRWSLNKIALDLSSAYVSKGKNGGSLFLGESKLNAEGIPQDSINFTSFSHIRYSAAERSSDQCEISYFVVQDPTTEQFVLFRREDYTLDDDLESGGEILDLVNGIIAFNIRYYNGEAWVDDWDSRNYLDMEEQFVEINVEQSEEMVDQVPPAVEIALSMADERGQEVYMTTKVKLPLSSIDLTWAEDESDDDDSTSGSGSGTSGNTPAAGGTPNSSGTSK